MLGSPPIFHQVSCSVVIHWFGLVLNHFEKSAKLRAVPCTKAAASLSPASSRSADSGTGSLGALIRSILIVAGFSFVRSRKVWLTSTIDESDVIGNQFLPCFFCDRMISNVPSGSTTRVLLSISPVDSIVPTVV